MCCCSVVLIHVSFLLGGWLVVVVVVVERECLGVMVGEVAAHTLLKNARTPLAR